MKVYLDNTQPCNTIILQLLYPNWYKPVTDPINQIHSTKR